MPANYVLLEKIVVGAAGASSVTFSNIPQTGYTDLVLKTSTRNSGSNVGNYSAFTIAGAYTPSGLFLRGNGTVASAGNSQYGQMETGGAATASSFSNTETYFPNYTSATYKPLTTDSVVENNATEGYDNFSTGLVSNNSAITSLTITAATGTFVQYSTFHLYGVAKLGTTPAISPYATGGDTIMTDGTYWYHAFKASGTFTPAKALSCDVLVVAGGGGSGQNNGGGGGAGGLVYSSSQSLTATNYTVTVGAGGAGASGDSNTGAQGSTGSNSNMTGGALSLTAAVGGGGAGGQGLGKDGKIGGSGGGGGNGGTGAAGTSGQGNAGGSSVNSGPSFPGGGGGGAGGAGGNASSGGTLGGQGGVGSSTYSSWGSATGTGQNVSGTYYYAGGGSGAGSTALAGGSGGGGSGAIYLGSPSVGSAGTANTGGGAGGSTGAGGVPTIQGGSGIVIVRYAV